jgi:hypothetical protein
MSESWKEVESRKDYFPFWTKDPDIQLSIHSPKPSATHPFLVLSSRATSHNSDATVPSCDANMICLPSGKESDRKGWFDDDLKHPKI